jgi:hypothetical protein
MKRTNLLKKNNFDWNCLVDRYLSCTDFCFERATTAATRVSQAVRDEDFRDLRQSLVLRITLCGIAITLGLLLVSCQTVGRRYPLPHQGAHGVGTEQRQDPLYVRRESTTIVPRHPEAHSGSIYAETRQPLNLFSDEASLLPGDFLTVTIPPELRYVPAQAEGTQKSSAKNPGAAGKDPGDSDLKKAMTTDIKSLVRDPGMGQEPMTKIKMEIAGIDGGTVFLKGTRSFLNARSGPGGANLHLTASAPISALRGRAIDASDLQRIEITRLDGDLSGNYRTDGWDAFVSRSLSGYAPDLGPDLERLQSFEDQLTQQQKVLTERFQSLKQEQARFRREQAEIERRRTLANNAAAAANQQGQSPQAQSNPAQNPQAPNQQQPVGAPTPNSATTGGAP